jgi:hypothetical protein
MRRYIAAGQIECYRLPGGHYRVPQRAIAAVLRTAERGRLQTAGRRDQDTSAMPQRASRRERLGASSHIYDLSAAHLAQLRSRFSQR